MKKFIIYLLVIVVAVSLGFAVFFLVRDNEVISISSATIYKDAGSKPFTIDVNHVNKKSYTKITISVSDDKVVSYDSKNNSFSAVKGGIARINFRTTNAKFRNLWCDVVVGDGTEESPFYISTPEQLAAIGAGVMDSNGVYAGSGDYPQYTSNACYKIVADIDAKDINEGHWIPLRAFSGRLDGNGYTIKNVNIDRESYIQYASKDDNAYDPAIFSRLNVGLFQEITETGKVYNLKLENFYAYGSYRNFGSIAAINRGTIERVEIKDANLSVETDLYFGGIVAKNETSESGKDDTYIRNIARIDRCSINMTVGKKTIFSELDGSSSEVVVGLTGTIGGLVGVNNGGTIVYSYANGEVSFADNSKSSITYGGLVGENRYIRLEKIGGKYSTVYQGGNIKDCYSNLKTNFVASPELTLSSFGGAIGINEDLTKANYEDDSTKDIVQNFIIGVYYNKDNLNIAQKDLTKNFSGIGRFYVKKTTKIELPYQDEQMVVFGLTSAEMKIADNYNSHSTYDIKFNDKGESEGIKETKVKWLFGTVWAIDSDTNNGMPYLNYQLVYIPDDFGTAGTPIVINKNRYTFEKGSPDFPITIVSGVNGKLSLMEGDTYLIKVSPAGSEVTWVSSNPGVVSVDQEGMVTAIKGGATATITATTKSGSVDNITIIVYEKSYAITGYPSTIPLIEGNTYQLKDIKVDPVTTLTYSSNDPTIATVSSTGLIKAIKSGTTIIYVNAGASRVDILVTVRPKVSTPENPGDPAPTYQQVDIDVGSTNILCTNFDKVRTGAITIKSANVNGTDIKDQLTFSFVSNNENVVSIMDSGTYYVMGTGTAQVKIEVMTTGYIGCTFVNFHVTPKPSEPSNPSDPNPPVINETLVFTQSSNSLYIGDVFTITYSGTSKVPTFTSSNTKVATVDSNGRVTAIGAGSATITGTITNDNGIKSSDTCSITVQKKAPIVITLTPSSQKIAIGTSVTIQATASDATGYLWSYTNANLATMTEDDDKVTITMNKVGNVTVTATSNVDGSSADAVIEGYDPDAYVKDIYTYEQLNNIRKHLGSEFRLCATIDLSGKAWEPIGTESKPFTGILTNAGSYKIMNMSVTDSADHTGLFGYTKNATISGIDFENVSVTNGKNSGALIGTAYTTRISDINVKHATVTATYKAGGVVGNMVSNSVLEKCELTGDKNITVNGNSTAYAGGIAGYMENSAVKTSTVNISGKIMLGSKANGYVGGIVGYATGKITDCVLAKGTVTANNSDTNYAGGIVGLTTNDIEKGVVKSSTISGYYAGGIGGEINISTSITVKFSDYKSGYRRSDISSSSYTPNVYQVAVKNGVKVKGNQIGGLFGVITSGVVKNCYTRASLEGTAKNSIKGGFASAIKSTVRSNSGGTGQTGIVEYCYSACTFSGTGTNYSITSSYVHNHVANNDKTPRCKGYCFNYVFDDGLDGNAQFYHNSNLLAKDNIGSKKSSADMKKSETYTNKGFSSSYWSFGGDYPTLKSER